jgi:hypothetical protein
MTTLFRMRGFKLIRDRRLKFYVAVTAILFDARRPDPFRNQDR